MYVCGGYYVTILIYINETYNSFPSKITDRYFQINFGVQWIKDK